MESAFFSSLLDGRREIMFGEAAIAANEDRLVLIGRPSGPSLKRLSAETPDAPPPRLVATSRDRGESFSIVRLDRSFPGPPTQVGTTFLRNGRLLVSFPFSTERWAAGPTIGRRRNLMLGLFDEGGKSQRMVTVDATGGGYSSLTRWHDRIAILYERMAKGRIELVFTTLSEARLLDEFGAPRNEDASRPSTADPMRNRRQPSIEFDGPRTIDRIRRPPADE